MWPAAPAAQHTGSQCCADIPGQSLPTSIDVPITCCLLGCQLAHASVHDAHLATWRSVRGAPLHQVVLRKMLRAVEALPLSADDVHLTRSAHGTFGDILQLLSYHSDLEVPPPVHHQQICTEWCDCRELADARLIGGSTAALLLLSAESALYSANRSAPSRRGCCGSTRCRRAHGPWFAAAAA